MSDHSTVLGLNERGNGAGMCHIERIQQGQAVECRLDVIDIYPWIYTESSSIVTQLLSHLFRR